MKNKILKTAGITALVLLTLICSAPYLFKGKITRLVNAQIDKNLRAHVNFSDLDISLFRHFPNITVGLENLRVTCVGEFQGDTLLTAKQFDIACGIGSLISGDSIKVYSFTADQPRFHALIRRNGHCNWKIIKPAGHYGDPVTFATRPFAIALKWYAIHKGHTDYIDEGKDIQVEIVNLEHEGKGDFASDLFTLNTKTTADEINVNMGDVIPYRLTAKTSMDMAFQFDNRNHTCSFNSDQVSFNDLKLHTEGYVQWVSDSSYKTDIKFNAPSSAFKNLLSMLPSVYQKEFASIKTNGQVRFDGFLKGILDDKHSPAYQVNLNIENGYFRYPDLPMPVENINLALQVDNPDGITDHKTVNISRGHIEMSNDTLDFHLLVKNPESRPYVDLAFTGTLDLANVPKLIKMESGTQLSGKLNADLYAKGNIPQTEKQKNAQFQAGGSFGLSDFLYQSKTSAGGITLNELLVSFNSKNVIINNLKGEYLAAHFNVSGAVKNLFDFALGNQPLKASLDFKADELDLRAWMRNNNNGAQRTATFVVPRNIDFTVDVEAGKLHYDNLDMQNLTGKLVIADETVQLHEVKADALDGSIIMDGSYSTAENRESPDISMTYDAKGVDIQKTFFAFNTVQKIMPVGKFISGKVNSQMSLKGNLGDNMVPDLQSIYGEGTIFLIEGSMKDFGPLDKLSQSLDIAELKDMTLKDVKTDFTFKAGKVNVSPFLVHTGDIDMAVGGTHGFDQSLDYNIEMKVPRSQLGNKGNLYVKNVVNQAAEKGIPVQLKDAVNFSAKMCGTINNPDVNTDMNAAVEKAAVDLQKEVNDFVNAKLDSAKQQLHKPAAPVKKQLFVQTGNKSKSRTAVKKTSRTTHKQTVGAKSKKTKKKMRKHYSA